MATKKAAKKAATKKAAAKKAVAKKAAAPVDRLLPPAEGATVRMYRIGHGDCFLIAFPGETGERPVYVLIDCGYKPGSPAHLPTPTSARAIADHIIQSTGGYVDIAVITHEHQDHVNGITSKNFSGLELGQVWFAWTEDPDDKLANQLRTTFHDQLLGLLGARNRLNAAGDTKSVESLDNFLAFELGGEEESFNARAAATMLGASAKDPLRSANKVSMKVFKDLAQKGIRYLRPHGKILNLPGTSNIRVYSLGPPRNEDLLALLDPVGGEEFHFGLANRTPGGYFAAAAAGPAAALQTAPFGPDHRVSMKEALKKKGSFYARHYGTGTTARVAPSSSSQTTTEVPDAADFRRIDKDWLHSSEHLALAMNSQTNNSSLVLAFELGKGGKVLLFAADSQRGNWLSWSQKDWKDGDQKVTTRDLLSRTVLYKTGHHGSHNATLNGKPSDDYANLSWMAQGEHADEFTAMITAVRSWAETQKGWDHPLKAIKDALIAKASGRVFQTDTDLDQMSPTPGLSKSAWKDFLNRTTGDALYFDHTIHA